MTKVRDLPDDADSVGIVAEDVDAIREEARRRAHALLTDGYRLGQNRSHWVLCVRDENDTVVFTKSLADAVAH